MNEDLNEEVTRWEVNPAHVELEKKIGRGRYKRFVVEIEED